MKSNNNQDNHNYEHLEGILLKAADVTDVSDIPAGFVSRAMARGQRNLARRRAVQSGVVVCAAACFCILAMIRQPHATARPKGKPQSAFPQQLAQAVQIPQVAPTTVQPASTIASNQHPGSGSQSLRTRKRRNVIANTAARISSTPMWTTTVVTSRHSGIVVNIPVGNDATESRDDPYMATIPVLTQVTLKQIPGDFPPNSKSVHSDN